MKPKKKNDLIRIAIAGGSGSGKSAIAEKIKKKLKKIPVEIVKLDRFFKPVSKLPKYRSKYLQKYCSDFNRPKSFKVKEMISSCKKMKGSKVIIFDGHFALYFPKLRKLFDIKCFVDAKIPEMLFRRTKRNLANKYGGSREVILNYNKECVIPRFKKYILPTRKYADIIIPNFKSSKERRDKIIDSICRKILGTF